MQITATHEPWTDDRVAFLDRSLEELQDAEDCTAAMDRLSDGLWWYRKAAPEDWKDWAKTAQIHPLGRLLHEDPFTHRSYSKPRGFPGDSGLIDLIYYDQGWANFRGVSPTGQRIFWRNRNAPAPRAVRARRDHMAVVMDRTALRKSNASVLAVACGNMREAFLSAAVHRGGLSRVVALDQDAEALKVVSASFGWPVEARNGTVKAIIANSFAGETFDFIYAAGLYDYLGQSLATALTTKLFGLLAGGGELLVANFVPDILDAGYMETFMGWNLIFRTQQELFDLTHQLPPAVRDNASIYLLEAPDICYLKVTKN